MYLAVWCVRNNPSLATYHGAYARLQASSSSKVELHGTMGTSPGLFWKTIPSM